METVQTSSNPSEVPNPYQENASPIYSQLAHIADVQYLEIDQKALKLLALIQHFGFGQHLGVSRLHKHFDITENQRVIWSKKQDNYFSHVTKTQFGSPVILQLNGNLNWQATEFFDGNNYWNQLVKKDNFSEFTQAFAKLVGQDQYLFGLAVDMGEGLKTLELTDMNRRLQKLVGTKEVDSEFVITKYFLTKTGDCQRRYCSRRSCHAVFEAQWQKLI